MRACVVCACVCIHLPICMRTHSHTYVAHRTAFGIGIYLLYCCGWRVFGEQARATAAATAATASEKGAVGGRRSGPVFGWGSVGSVQTMFFIFFAHVTRRARTQANAAGLGGPWQSLTRPTRQVARHHHRRRRRRRHHRR